MNPNRLAISACLFAAMCLFLRAEEAVSYADGRLSNGMVTVAFGKDGTFSIQETGSGEILLADARFALPWDRRGVVDSISTEDIQDELGRGKRVILEVTDSNELRYQAPAKRLFTYALYENHPALVCGFGIKTPNYLSLRLRDFIGNGNFEASDRRRIPVQARLCSGDSGAAVIEDGQR